MKRILLLLGLFISTAFAVQGQTFRANAGAGVLAYAENGQVFRAPAISAAIELDILEVSCKYAFGDNQMFNISLMINNGEKSIGHSSHWFTSPAFGVGYQRINDLDMLLLSARDRLIYYFTPKLGIGIELMIGVGERNFKAPYIGMDAYLGGFIAFRF